MCQFGWFWFLEGQQTQAGALKASPVGAAEACRSAPNQGRHPSDSELGRTEARSQNSDHAGAGAQLDDAFPSQLHRLLADVTTQVKRLGAQTHGRMVTATVLEAAGIFSPR